MARAAARRLFLVGRLGRLPLGHRLDLDRTGLLWFQLFLRDRLRLFIIRLVAIVF